MASGWVRNKIVQFIRIFFEIVEQPGSRLVPRIQILLSSDGAPALLHARSLIGSKVLEKCRRGSLLGFAREASSSFSTWRGACFRLQRKRGRMYHFAISSAPAPSTTGRPEYRPR